jgi:hypothetical protein
VAGAERVQRRQHGLEVAQRLAQQHERGEEHRLLAAHVGAGEQRLDRRRGLEQARVEDVHQLVAVRGDEVEAGFESVKVHAESFPPRGRSRDGASYRTRWRLTDKAIEDSRHDGFAALQAGAVEQRRGPRQAGAGGPARGAVEHGLDKAGAQQGLGDVSHHRQR